MDEYTLRNETLALLGFKSYRAYLRSPLWKSIRQRQLTAEPRCYGCNGRAAQVHHGSYDIAILTGDSNVGIFSICKRCHQRIEFTRSGLKRSPFAATQELKRIRRSRISSQWQQ